MSDIPIPHDIEPHPLTRMYNGKFGIWLFLASEIMLFGALFSTYVLLRVGAAPGTWPIFGSPTVHGHEVLNVPLATLNTVVLITSSVTMVLAWAALKVGELGKGRMYLLVTFLLAGTFMVVKYFEYKSKLTHHHIVLREAPSDETLRKAVGHLTVRTNAGERDLWYVNGHVTENNEEQDYVRIVPDAVKAPHGAKSEAHAEDAHAAGSHDPIQIDRSLIKRMSVWGPQASTFLGIYFTLTALHGLHILGGMVVILYLYLTASGWWKRSPDKLVNRVECTGLYWHFVDLVWIFLFPVLYLL